MAKVPSSDEYTWTRPTTCGRTERNTKTYPLNSKRLTAEVLTKVAKGLGLPTSASVAETRQLVEGKLETEQYEPKNVQVDVIELATGAIEVRLRNESGVILEVPADEFDTAGKHQEEESRTGSTRGGETGSEDETDNAREAGRGDGIT